MNQPQKWPILHILVGIPIVLVVSTLIGAAVEGWQLNRAAWSFGGTMTAPVAMVYTFLVTLGERSYYMVFWARERIKEEMKQLRADAVAEGAAEGEARGEARGVAIGEALGEARGEARGISQRDREWRDWYERMQEAQREGKPFDDPPPAPPENGHHD